MSEGSDLGRCEAFSRACINTHVVILKINFNHPLKHLKSKILFMFLPNFRLLLLWWHCLASASFLQILAASQELVILICVQILIKSSAINRDLCSYTSRTHSQSSKTLVLSHPGSAPWPRSVWTDPKERWWMTGKQDETSWQLRSARARARFHHSIDSGRWKHPRMLILLG